MTEESRAAGTDPSPADARLRAVVRMAQATTGVATVAEVVRAAADHTRAALDAAMSAVSVWERAEGRLRVLVNDGELAPGEVALPDNEVYPVADFPEIAHFLNGRHTEHGWTHGELPRAWTQTADDPSSGPFCQQRAQGLRHRGRSCCVVAPILLEGRAWGELYAARKPGVPVFTQHEVDFAAVLAGQVSVGLAQTVRLARVRQLAYTDSLTGLANRRAVDARLADALRRHQEDGTVVSLIVCDVNGLKRLNDERGHAVGDRILERFADQLSLAAATLPGALAARLGGDEFCVLAEGPSADAVVRAAEETCRAALRFPEGEGVACGIASTSDPIGAVDSPARLFRLADAAQYRAKASKSATPVVAGRGGRPDAVLKMADEAARAARMAGQGRHRPFRGRRGGAERRRFRGRVHSADPACLLESTLAALDDEDAADDAAANTADAVNAADLTPAGLVTVADNAARMVDAAAWTIHHQHPAGGELRPMRYSVQRGDETDAEPLAARPLDPSGHPQTLHALRGGGFAVQPGSGNPPEEADMLLAGGYRAAVVAGGADASGGWLLRVLADDASLPMTGLAPALRALCAVALQRGGPGGAA